MDFMQEVGALGLGSRLKSFGDALQRDVTRLYDSLELDFEVWKKYGIVILRRLGRMLDLKLDRDDPPDPQTVNFLMETLCHIDGTECDGEVSESGEIIFRVYRCSWWENLRNSGREKIVPCEEIDNTIFRHWLEAVDPGLTFEITHSRPRGDDHCQWTIKKLESG